MTHRTRQLLVVVAAAVNLVLNALAGAGVLFGTATGAVSDAYPTGVTPAGWAFSIWSVVFLGVVVFAVWQALPAQRGPRYDALGAPFVAANVLNGLWQIPWLTGHVVVSAVVLVGILASLIWLYVRLDRMGLRGVERWTLGLPVSLFLAWVTVATALNVTIALQALGWTAAGVGWPIAVIALVTGVAAWWLRRTGDVAAALVVLWAFVAIYAAHPDRTELGLALAAGASVLVVAAALGVRAHGAAPTSRSASPAGARSD